MPSLHLSEANTTLLPNPESVGQWVRTQRRLMQMTQVELAKKANVTRRQISEFESGKISVRLDTLWKIFAALQLRFAAVDLKVSTHEQQETEW